MSVCHFIPCVDGAGTVRVEERGREGCSLTATDQVP